MTLSEGNRGYVDRAPVLVGVVDNLLLRGKPSVLTVILVSLPLLCYCSSTNDPGHSAKSAGHRLQLNTHSPKICGFARSGTVSWCMVHTKCTETTAASRGMSHVTTK